MGEGSNRGPNPAMRWSNTTIMNAPIHISRNFTEIGAFEAAEVIDFYKRGILKHTDYVRVEGADSWLPLHDWIGGANNPSGSPAADFSFEAMPAEDEAPVADGPQQQSQFQG